MIATGRDSLRRFSRPRTRQGGTRSGVVPFLVPALILFGIWQLYPMLRVVGLAFTDYVVIGSAPTSFVGFRNFIEAFGDPLVRSGLARSLVFTLIFLPGAIILPLLAAVALTRVRSTRLAGFYRVVLLVPALLPGPLIFIMWRWLYSPAIGPLNYLLVDVLGWFTIHTVPNWAGDPTLVLPSIVVMEWWWGIGYHTIFFLAGLAAIPMSTLESARVDGAHEGRVFWHILLPGLRPIIAVLVILRLGSAFAGIEEFLIYGGVNRALPTYTWTVYMWDTAFKVGKWEQGYASAVGLIGTLAVLALIVLMLRLGRLTRS